MAAHLEEQQDLENFKHFWRTWGRWIFVILLAAALSYLGWTVYRQHQEDRNREAAALLADLAEKAQAGQDGGQAVNSVLQNLQQNYADSIAAAQASMMVAASEFDKGRYETAEAHLNWVLKHQNTPFVSALAVQRLAVVQLQQQKYDAALATLNTPVDAAFSGMIDEMRGDVLSAQNKQQEALAAYEAALTKVGEHDAARELLKLKAEALK
ncbi:MAG: tetratricopeptide repeat protein [Neisseria sp.]|nr:tetratricopeptide repeat protein [Neisseria sp.]